MKIKHSSDYRERRRAEYPPLADFADAIYWAERGEPGRLQEYFEAIDQVKQKYPKVIAKTSEDQQTT